MLQIGSNPESAGPWILRVNIFKKRFFMFYLYLYDFMT